jgi:RNA polymerase sigma-70 factor (ECF subfamily)
MGHDGPVDFEPYRGELVAYCYRMLGSVHDAEDLAQETMLRAWQARDRYDPSRASVRTWLYRIATNACLSALTGRARRPLPSGLGAPSRDPAAPLTPSFDIPWLQPFPDARFDPGVRTGLRLALVAAMQVLPPRQRAVLVLREVLEFSAAEVAGQLGSTVPAVNSALQRARAQLERVAPAPERVGTAPTARQRELADQYVTAFIAADVATLTRLLADEVVLEMPPYPMWFQGRETVAQFLTKLPLGRPDRWRIIMTSANGQPALGGYRIEDDGRHHARMIQVLHASEAGLTWLPAFHDEQLFPFFGLPLVYPEGGPPAAS